MKEDEKDSFDICQRYVPNCRPLTRRGAQHEPTDLALLSFWLCDRQPVSNPDSGVGEGWVKQSNQDHGRVEGAERICGERNAAYSIMAQGENDTPKKAKYICAHQRASFTLRLQKSGGLYIY